MLTVVGIEEKTRVSTLVLKSGSGKLVSRTDVQPCEKCLLTINENIVVHKLCFCSGNTDERSNVWSLYQEYFGFKALRELLGLTPSAQYGQVSSINQITCTNSFWVKQQMIGWTLCISLTVLFGVVQIHQIQVHTYKHNTCL